MAEEGGAGDSQSANRARVLAVLGAIATGVGVVGFVTVVGGAVLWIRFNAVAIPADQAVSAIPSGELVAVGLATLLPYIGLALVVLFLAFLFAADNIVPTAPAQDMRERWASDGAQPGAPAAAISTPPSRARFRPPRSKRSPPPKPSPKRRTRRTRQPTWAARSSRNSTASRRRPSSSARRASPRRPKGR